MQPEPATDATGCDPPIAHALHLLDYFCTHIMPTVLRRVSAWKGCLPQRRRELAAELRQELALDCLQHPRIVCDLNPRARHTRWFRQLQRLLYRQHFRGSRCRDGDSTVELAVATCTGAELQDGLDVRALLQQDGGDLLQRLLRGADQMGNGRCNMSTTADRLGVHQHAVRTQWNELAAQLGFGGDFLHFWCRRLGEATLGWAADVLRQHADLRLHDEQRRRQPDPAARRRRIRRIRTTVNIRPLPDELRRMLAELQRCRASDPRDALLLLDIAARLDPFASAVQLWRFEALIAIGDLGGAVSALRRARALGAATVPVLLARARLLEARGRDPAAAHLLARGLLRCRHDQRVLASLRAVAAAPAG